MRRSLGPKTNTPRLACVKPAASVHPEPGSNSSSYILILYDNTLACSNLSIQLLSFFYVSISRDGCQFNMSMNVSSFLITILSVSGCKSTSFLLTRKQIEKKYFSFFHYPFFVKKLSVLRTAKIKPLYIPCKSF